MAQERRLSREAAARIVVVVGCCVCCTGNTDHPFTCVAGAWDCFLSESACRIFFCHHDFAFSALELL